MKQAKIEKLKDGTFLIESWTNADGSEDTAIYKSIEEVAKVSPLIAKEVSGLSREANLTTIWFNEDGTVHNVSQHSFSRTKDEAPEVKTVKGEDLDQQYLATIETLKTELTIKTGAGDGVDPIQP